MCLLGVHAFLDQQGCVELLVGVEEGDGSRRLAQGTQPLLFEAEDAGGVVEVERARDTIGQAAFGLWSLHVGQCAARKLFKGELANVDAVHPGQLFGVVDAAGYADALQREDVY